MVKTGVLSESEARPALPAAADSPRVTQKTACGSSKWEWLPGVELNHRHADFQSAALLTDSVHSRQ